MKIDWSMTAEFGDHYTVGRLSDGRWFWTWNMEPGQSPERLLEMGSEDGEDGGEVFDSYTELIDAIELNDIVNMTLERFGEPLQRVNMDIDRYLWRELSIRAAEKGITKREAVETALREWLKNKPAGSRNTGKT